MKSANPEHWDFYKKFRRRMQSFCESPKGKSYKFRELLLIAPDLLHLCIHLVIDPEVPVKHKAKLVAVISYFISPIDLLPEAILGPFGYLDDIALTAYVLNSLLNDVPEHVIDRYWAGEKDLLPLVRGIVMGVDRMLGKGLWTRLKSSFNSNKLPSDMKHGN